MKLNHQSKKTDILSFLIKSSKKLKLIPKNLKIIKKLSSKKTKYHQNIPIQRLTLKSKMIKLKINEY